MASRPRLNLHPRSSYFSIFRALRFDWTASQAFLTSPTFRVVNPRNHITKGDRVSVRVSPSVVSGLQDEAILALLTKGFFGGWVFFMEGWAMRTFHPLLPAIYTGM
ncbi:hypothetical protein GLAREA_09192 [Glarea lozoyensis ATCC 20868]|uniref:Uncharacterized protein n=1 Tax=Glarea lozoyensis (strain ATCC 20868 / MF5171) TaxID=1116229 RepID=S3DIN8_GLAL2|nr:uncharacterized protein GLAREA_09192 [Glarea lozoyensis ATCC 20868]EPE37029.1 hypothetical protein GLAREA_09192 [Glarea lozoyensis ATCC 20868]